MKFIEKDINKGIEGTLLNAELLKKANWRDDDYLSFKILETDEEPKSLIDATQIYTKQNGETWLLPPGNMKASVQLGKTTGTTIKVNNLEQDTIEFSGDPQTQINGRSTVRINNARADLDFTSDPQTQLNNKLNKSPNVSSVLDLYPIGSIYMSTVDNSPSNFIGGVWDRWGQGKAIVGVDTTDADFNTSGKTGGNKALQQHKHIVNNNGTSIDGTASMAPWRNNFLTVQNSGKFTWTNAGYAALNISGNSSYTTGQLNFNGDHNHTAAVTGTGAAESATNGNLQPYITCYMWKRSN